MNLAYTMCSNSSTVSVWVRPASVSISVVEAVEEWLRRADDAELIDLVVTEELGWGGRIVPFPCEFWHSLPLDDWYAFVMACWCELLHRDSNP